MPDKITREAKLAACLVFAAIYPISSWCILLFVAKPPHLSTAEAAWAQLSYVFSSENPDRWWFVVWAILPVLFLALAIACYAKRPLGAASLRVLAFAGCAFAAASAFHWPTEVLPIAGVVYVALPRRASADKGAAR